MESLSDIETELRTLSQSSKYCELQPTVFGKSISFYFAEIADRIKAAAPTTEKSSAVGNAAALHEALTAIRKALLFDSSMGLYTLFHAEVDSLTSTALAAPPRNCDLFGGDYKMLHTAWFDWTGSPSGHLPDGTAKMTFAAWLLALAAERKGEGDGK